MSETKARMPHVIESKAARMKTGGNIGAGSGMNRAPMTKTEQKNALKNVQLAEKRVKLGMELLKASENRISAQSHMLNQVRAEQKHLREQIQEDVTKSLQSYDQWMGQLDESFSKAIQMLEEKVDAVMGIWETKEKKLDDMIKRFERLHEQNHRVLFEIKARGLGAGSNEEPERRDEPIIVPDEAKPVRRRRMIDELDSDLCIPQEQEPNIETIEDAEVEAETKAEQSELPCDPADALAEMAEQKEMIYSQLIDGLREQSTDEESEAIDFSDLEDHAA